MGLKRSIEVPGFVNAKSNVLSYRGSSIHSLGPGNTYLSWLVITRPYVVVGAGAELGQQGIGWCHHCVGRYFCCCYLSQLSATHCVTSNPSPWHEERLHLPPPRLVIFIFMSDSYSGDTKLL